MKRVVVKVVMLAALAVGLSLLPLHHAKAITVNHNNLIDNSVFDNFYSLDAGQIDGFLNGFRYSCISPNSGFAAIDPIGYNPSQGYLFGGYVTAGKVIYDSAVAYGINPQVLLVTLQKEQSLVAGGSGYCSNGDEHKYAAAMGYGCPDSGTTYSYTGLSLYRRNGNIVGSTGTTCVNGSPKAGFSQQVIRAAWLLKFGQQRSMGNTGWAVIRGSWDNSDDPPTCYGGPMTQGTWKTCQNGSATYYDGWRTIDSVATHMDTGATASLYWYTPHFHGNENFVTLFTSWFGGTTGPAYSWSIENFTYSGGDSTIVIGETETVTLYARNTGRNPWYPGGPNPVRLGLWGVNSTPLYTPGSWYSPIRAATLTSNTMPGEIGVFTFQISPSVAGTFVVPFNIVAENATWAPWPGFSPTITVVNPYSWALDGVDYSSGGGIMEVGATQTITIHARNTGSITWHKNSGPSVRVGKWGAGNSPVATGGWLSPTRAAVLDSSTPDVAPGDTGIFTFDVTMPGLGNYYEQLNLVAEGVAWFNPGVTLYLRGGSFAWQPVWSSLSTGNANIGHGQTFDITIRARNTGELAWHKTGNFPVRLATAGPQNRGSALERPSWFSSVRPAALVENTVLPGQEGTFTFNAVSPLSPGPRYERFSLVAEGYMWFNDPGLSVFVNSL